MNNATKSVLFGSDKQDWGTPKGFFHKLHAEFGFHVDVCASAHNAKLPVFYDEALNCLSMGWDLAAIYIRKTPGLGYEKGRVCGCPCHFRNRQKLSPGVPLPLVRAIALAQAPLCGCLESCSPLPMVAFMNPPYGDAEQPCAKTCHKKKCMGSGHKADCPPDCTSKKCVGRGYHTDVYIPGIADFMEQAFSESLHGHTSVCLVPSRVDTQWWNTWVQGRADEVRHIVGRLVFEDENGNEDSAPFPTSVVVYRPPQKRLHTHVTVIQKP